MEILLPKRLDKYYIIGDRRRIEESVAALQDLGVFHINYVDANLKLKKFESDVSSDLHTKLIIEEFLELNKSFGFKYEKHYQAKNKTLRDAAAVVSDLHSVERELKRLSSKSEKLRVLDSLGIKDVSLLDYKGKISVLWSKHREKIRCIRKTEFNNHWYYLVDAETAKTNRKLGIIITDTLKEPGLTTVSGLSKETERAVKKAAARKRRLMVKYKQILEEYGESLASWLTAVRDEVIRKRSIQKIADEGNFFIISCFAPKNFKMDVLASKGLKIIKSGFLPEEAPTVRKRGKLMKDFSFLTWLYGTPLYNEVDPSLSIAITFPLMFGAIVGDIGYGLVLMFGALAISRFHEGFKKNLFWLFFLSGIASIFFGFMFGEFFGNLVPLHPLLFYRLTNVMSLIFGSIIAGSIILSLAFVFNEIDAILGGRRNKIIGAAGWLLLNSFILYEVLLLYFYGVLNIYAALIIPIAAVFVAIGQIYETSQILNLFANVVSYLRIAAVGLASVMIAILINELGGALAAYSVIIAITIATVFHLLNILLDALIAFLQSLRLEYVEFLSKFLRGNGEEYEPLEHVKEK